jgi:hypothetical protein
MRLTGWQLIKVGRVLMDFIEKLFGVAPDGGSGALEFLLFAIPIAGVCYLALRRRVGGKK